MTVKITKPALNLREEIAKAQSNNADEARIGSLVSDSIDAVAIDAETLSVGEIAANVGIGTTPSTILHVANTASASVQSIRLENSEGYAQLSTDSNVATYDAQQHLFNNRARSTEFARIDSSGNLGIGTTSPSSYSSLANNLVVAETAGNAGATIVSSNTGSSNLHFADTDDASIGRINYEHNGDYMRFYTANTERARIDASGNLLVGTTATNIEGSSTEEGFAYIANATMKVATSGQDVAIFNRQASDGSVISFRKDGATVGSIGVADSNNVYLTGDGGTTGIKFGTNIIYPCTTNGTTDNGVKDLGSAGSRFKDLYLSGGVYVGGTGAANYLDDYEEGTFTPAISGDSGASGQTYSVQTGKYVKVGSLVTCWIDIQLTNKGTLTGGTVGLTNASPFAAEANSLSVSAMDFSNLTGSGWTFFGLRGGADFVYFRGTKAAQNSISFVSPTEITDTTIIRASYSFRTAS